MIERNNAGLRCMRELAGYSQRQLADAFDVNVASVKKWERPDWHGPIPDGMFEILEDALEERERRVCEMLDAIDAEVERDGSWPELVILPYYRNQDHYDECRDDRRACPVVDAATREVVTELVNRGVDVKLVYPGDRDEDGEETR